MFENDFVYKILPIAVNYTTYICIWIRKNTIIATLIITQVYYFRLKTSLNPFNCNPTYLSYFFFFALADFVTNVILSR